LVVVVKIFIAQRQAEHALLEEFFERVLDFLGITVIVEASRKFGQQSTGGLDLPQKQATGVGRDRSAVEATRDLACSQGLKIKRRSATLCLHRAASLLAAKVVLSKQLIPKEQPFFNPRREKCGLAVLLEFTARPSPVTHFDGERRGSNRPDGHQGRRLLRVGVLHQDAEHGQAR